MKYRNIEYPNIQYCDIEYLNIAISQYLQEAPELWAFLGDSPASVQDLHPAVVHLLVTFVSLLQDRDGKKIFI